MATVGGCAFLVLTYEVVSAQASQREWKAERTGIQLQLAELRQRVDAANAETAVLAAKKAELTQKIAALDADRTHKEADSQRLKADIDALTSRRAALGDQVTEREKHEQEVTRRIAPVERRLHDLEQQRDRTNTELEAAKTQLSQLRNKPPAAQATPRPSHDASAKQPAAAPHKTPHKATGQ